MPSRSQIVPKSCREFFWLAVFFVCPLLAGRGEGAWTVLERTEQPGGDIIFFSLRLRGPDDEIEMHGAQFAPNRFEFRVISNLSRTYSSAQDAVVRNGAVAGVNGGYFQADFSPVGLLVSGRQVLHPLVHAPLLSGVFCVSDGRPKLLRTHDFHLSERLTEAIECGPFLVEKAKPVPGLNAQKSASRTFVYETANGAWGVAICRSVTLAEMGEILSSIAPAENARISQALNLDGGSSSDFFGRAPSGELASAGFQAVANYLLVYRISTHGTRG